MGCIKKTDPTSVLERPQSSHSSLIDPRFEHESCGVGCVATLTNEPSHDILAKALTALARLEHRGAIAADGKSGDGIGIATAIPREFLLRSTGITLAQDRPLAVGVVFFPQGQAEAHAYTELNAALAAQKLTVLGWRDVPIRREVLGEIALSTLPEIRQVLVTAEDLSRKDRAAMDRRLYLARKQFERTENAMAAQSSQQGTQYEKSYVCSLSSSNMVYK